MRKRAGQNGVIFRVKKKSEVSRKATVTQFVGCWLRMREILTSITAADHRDFSQSH